MLLLALYRSLGAASHALPLLVGDRLRLLLRKAPVPCAIPRLTPSSNSGYRGAACASGSGPSACAGIRMSSKPRRRKHSVALSVPGGPNRIFRQREE